MSGQEALSGGVALPSGPSWSARGAPPKPARARGHTAAAAAAAIAAIEAEEAAADSSGGSEGAPGLVHSNSGVAFSMPPQLCSTLSDLSFNLGNEEWWESMGGDAAAFPEGAALIEDDVFGDGGLAPPVGTRLLRRLSSSFSDWKRLEPPMKK